MERHLGTLTLEDFGSGRDNNFDHLVEHPRCFQLVIGMNCQQLGRRKEPESKFKGFIIGKEVIFKICVFIRTLPTYC